MLYLTSDRAELTPVGGWMNGWAHGWGKLELNLVVVDVGVVGLAESRSDICPSDEPKEEFRGP